MVMVVNETQTSEIEGVCVLPLHVEGGGSAVYFWRQGEGSIFGHDATAGGLFWGAGVILLLDE